MYANLLWRERGSNPRRADYDSTVLPTELSRQRIVQFAFNLHLICTNILYHSIYVCLFVCALHPLHQMHKMCTCVYIYICWSKRIRTFASRNQKPTPFHLAILHTICTYILYIQCTHKGTHND